MSENKEQHTEETAGEMGFFDHLDELRKRIVYALLGLIVGSIICGVFINQLMEIVLLGPAQAVKLDLQNLKPFGIPFLYFKVVLFSGIIVSFPFILYQIWRFLAPGLYENEKKWARKITFYTSLCFLTGVAFAYFVMIPSMLGFAATFGTEKIQNIIDVNEYFSFITMIMLAAGILFEMPMVAFILARFGLVSPKTMRKYWRHAIISILILAAVLTPTPDPISQLIFAGPLFILYELSIIIAKLAYKEREITE